MTDYNRIVRKSNFKMHCFSCNSVINRGDEITQCLESGGMELRDIPFTGSRWVHAVCLPKDILTMNYVETLDQLQDDYPDTPWEEIEAAVENHDYWIHEVDSIDSIEDSLESEESDSDESEHEMPNTVFEKAKSSNTKCVICDKYIAKGEPRVAKLNKKYKTYGNYKHQECWDNEVPTFEEDVCVKVENSNYDEELQKMKEKLEELLYWSSNDMSEEEKLVRAKEMCKEKKVFDKIVDETLEMLARVNVQTVNVLEQYS